MNRKEAWDRFEAAGIRPLFEKSLEKAEEVFRQEKESFRERMLPTFAEACRQMNEEQPEVSVAYICFELLRTRLLSHSDSYRIVMYDEEWYLGNGFACGNLDAGILLKLYHQLEEDLKAEAKRYVGRIAPIEVEALAARLLPPFQEYVKELLLYAVSDATELEDYRRLKKEKELQIRAGECLEPGYLIYTEAREKDPEGIRDQLNRQRLEAHCFQDFKGLDLSGLDLSGHDFRYADFRDARLEHADLSRGSLEGCVFRRCEMTGAVLKGSALHAADFRAADLRNARLDYVLMYDGRDRAVRRKPAGWPEARFAEADLRNAVFYGAVCCGVDFRGARLTGADFREAVLYRCRFQEEQLRELKLTEEQREQLGGGPDGSQRAIRR